MKNGVSVYFDTDVYRFARERGETQEIRRLLESTGIVLVLSSGNIFETLAIESERERSAEADAIVDLCPKFEEKPESWQHAQELIYELRRKRQDWIRPVRYLSSVRRYLDGHSALWGILRRCEWPDPQAYAAFRRDFERGVANNRDFQKLLRSLRAQKGDYAISGPLGNLGNVDISNPEVFWRVDGLMAWYDAVVARSPASRDYADWIVPHLKPHVFESESYPTFWLRDASANALPLNRLTGLVTFYQLQHKISQCR